MDANLLKLVTDAGTVGIVLYVLVNVLSAYHTTVTRLTDLLENMIDDKQAAAEHMPK
jgi:hypothetical protein